MSDETYLSYNKENSKLRVVVGMSGGVDSSLCALILKKQGYDVVGLFMKNWEESEDGGVCTSETDYADVVRVCNQLEIPCFSVEFVKEYRDQVFTHFLSEYAKGRTPNPDILCNREIKFKTFFDHAMKLGGDLIAMGHYCQTALVDGRQLLLKGVDPGKDQSYFLHAVKSDKLEKTLFPVGALLKSDVRRLAHQYNLSTKAKKDSTGICFIGERHFRTFLSGYLQAKPGPFKLLDGTIVGEHTGSCFYTIGQRKGLGLGGQGDPWFVVGKDGESNTVIVERGERHPALFCDYLMATEVTWVNESYEVTLPKVCKAKIRYRQSDQDCLVEQGDLEGTLKVSFPIPQRGVAQGQSVVFYDGEICLGGAVIDRKGPTYFEMGKELPDIVSI